MQFVVMLICILSLVLYYVKSLQVVMSELSMELFDLVQAWMLCKYGCICASVVFMILCVTVIVMSSVYMYCVCLEEYVCLEYIC